MANQMMIAGRPLDLLPTRKGTRWEGGGRSVGVQTSITGRHFRTLGHATPRYLNFDSPEGYVISAADAAFLTDLAQQGTPFSITVPDGYDESGTWNACLFDGTPRFPRGTNPAYRGYQFRLSLG